MVKNLPKLPKKKRVPTPKSASPKERLAREVLGTAINADNSIGPHYGHYMAWAPGDDDITLDSRFTLGELEALVWWIRHKGKRK